MKKLVFALLASQIVAQGASAAATMSDVIQQLRKNKVEAALKTREKIKITTSPDQFLYQVSECLVYNNKSTSRYNPLKAYEFYKKIQYSDYVTNAKVLNAFREAGGFDIETLRVEVENNMLAYAADKGTDAAYDEIIRACDNCSYIEDAKKAKENLVLKKMIKGATLLDIEKFIADYPNSSSLPRAIELRDSIAYAQLPKTADAYQAYVQKYPNSKYVAQIKKNLQKMSYDEAKTNDDINSYAKYIANYPNDEKAVKEFESKIADLQKYQTWKIEAKYKAIRLAKDTVKNKQYYLVNNFGAWGVMDFNGKTLIDPMLEDVADVTDGKLIAKKGGKWGIVDVTDGTIILDFVAPSAADVVPISPNFILFKQGNLWGLSYKGEKNAIPPFVSGSLTPFKYKVLTNGGVAMNEAGRLVIVDKEGNMTHNDTYDEARWRTADDIDSKYIKVRRGKKYGLFGTDGQQMEEIIHDMMPYFDGDGVAIIKTSPTMEGWMDTTGAKLYHGVLQEYKDCGSTEKMIAYKTGSLWGFLDKTASHANISCQYTEVIECFSDGLAKVKTRDGKVAYIDRSGSVIVSVPEAQSAQLTKVGSNVFKKNGNSYEVYSSKGKIGDLEGYDKIDSDISNGVMIVKKDGKYGANKGITQIVEPKYDAMTKYCNGYSIVTLGGKQGLLYYGQVVLAAEFDKIQDPNHYLDGDCDMATSGKESNVIYLNTWGTSGNMKYVIKEGQILMQTADEIRVRKFDNLYTAIETAEMGLFNAAKTALISPKGKVLVAPYYKQIAQLGDKYFTCTNHDGKVGVLDETGAEVVAPFAQSIQSFDGKVVVGEVGGDKMCFNKSGISFLPVGSDLDGNVFKNKKNNKYGVVDDRGNIMLSASYSKIGAVADKSAIVEHNGKFGVIKF